MRIAVWALVVCPLGLVALAQNTDWLSPSQDYGQFLNPQNAYYDDAYYARAPGDWTHVYYGYPLSFASSTKIVGLEVRLDAWRVPSGVPHVVDVGVSLSWDGGDSWTAPKVVRLPTYESTLLVGGPNDLWGRIWSPAELSSDLFRVRLEVTRRTVQAEARVDWVAVRIYYQAELALQVAPTLLHFGELALEDYDRGYRDLPIFQTVDLRCPTSWTLYVRADTDTWRYTGDLPDPGKSASHLLWRVAAVTGPVTWWETQFQGLTTTNRPVAQGNAGQATLALAFRLVVDYDTTPPGSYLLDFTYTLVAP